MSFVTTNLGKFKEISAQMADHGYVLEHIRTPYPEIQADSLEATIIPGLQWVLERYERPIMIDDSGLFIDALRGFPGVYSSYVFKTIGCDGILNLMKGMTDRHARFECCIGFIAPGKDPFLAKGVARGTISHEKAGTGGFGYDPIFVHEGYSKTYAQIDIAEKNSISHRGRALAKFIEELPKLLD
jgi:XTP/dITP diphosphohydrolase